MKSIRHVASYLSIITLVMALSPFSVRAEMPPMEPDVEPVATEAAETKPQCAEKDSASIEELAGKLAVGDKQIIESSAQASGGALPSVVKEGVLSKRDGKQQFKTLKISLDSRADSLNSCSDFKKYADGLEEEWFDRTIAMKKKMNSMYADLSPRGHCPLTKSGEESKKAWAQVYEWYREATVTREEADGSAYLEISMGAVETIESMPNIKAWQSAKVVRDEEDLVRMGCIKSDVADRMALDVDPGGTRDKKPSDEVADRAPASAEKLDSKGLPICGDGEGLTTSGGGKPHCAVGVGR
jgi:hypothetical protein